MTDVYCVSQLVGMYGEKFLNTQKRMRHWRKKRHPLISGWIFILSIRPLSSAYLGSGCCGVPQQHFPALPGGFKGISRLDEIYIPCSKFLVYPGVSSQLNMSQKTSKGRRPGGILIKCLNFLNLLLSTQKEHLLSSKLPVDVWVPH